MQERLDVSSNAPFLVVRVKIKKFTVLGIAPNDHVKVHLLDGRTLSLKPQRLTPLVAQAATLPLTMDWNNFASMFAESRDLRGAEAVALRPTFDGSPVYLYTYIYIHTYTFT